MGHFDHASLFLTEQRLLVAKLFDDIFTLGAGGLDKFLRLVGSTLFVSAFTFGVGYGEVYDGDVIAARFKEASVVEAITLAYNYFIGFSLDPLDGFGRDCH